MEYDYYGNRRRVPEEEHQRRVELQKNLRTELRSTNDPFAISTTEFQKLYRMPQHRLMEVVEILRPYMPVRRGSSYIAVELRVLCAVGFFAQGPYQRPLGRMVDLNLCQTSVSVCINEVASALNHPAVLTRFVRFPTTREERERFIQRNARLGLPGVLGYIYGTLIHIVTPCGPNKHVHRTRKRFTGLNAQIVCDSQLYIMNVNSIFPG